MVGVSNLPVEQENLLIEILLNQSLRHKKFSKVLKSQNFQERAPKQHKERQRLANRRNYLLNSPNGFCTAVNAYHSRLAFDNRIANIPSEGVLEEEQEELLPSRLRFETNDISDTMSPLQDDHDIEIPLSWDPRYNVGSIQLFQGDTVTRHHEVRKQIRFCIQIANAKDQDLYSARLSQNRDGIVMTEPIVPRHLRDASKLTRWATIASAVKSEQKNENLTRDISVKVQEINSLTPPVKKIFFRFPDGITCNNKAFNDNDKGNPPSDGHTLIKWPFMLPDGNLDLPGFPRKVVDDGQGMQERVPYDNLVPGFFWDMALDAEKVERIAQETIIDPDALANRLQAALELDG